MTLKCLAQVSAALSAGLLCLSSSAAAEDNPIPANLQRAIAHAADKIDATMSEYGVPGAVVVVVDRDSVLFEKGFGVADMASGRIPDPQSTRFRIASVSKTFTALAALQEVDKGHLALDTDVGPLLPSGMLDRRVAGALTLHHLLTHTSGLDRRNLGTRVRSVGQLQPLGEHLMRALPPLVREPGEALVYSNYGYTLIGYLVEESSGIGFAELVARTVFEPVGMSHSSFKPDAEGQGFATGYVRREPIDLEPGQTIPAGQMSTSGSDMARFMRAMLNRGQIDGRQVLDAVAIERMCKAQFRNAPRLPAAYGYGLWVVRRDDARWNSVYHEGDMRGWAAAIEVFPAAGIGVFTATNAAEGGNVHIAFVHDLVEQLARKSESSVSADGPVARLSDYHTYVGEYLYGGVPQTTFDRITALLEGAMPVALGANGELLVDNDPYTEVAPGLFRRVDDGAPRLAMVVDSVTSQVTVRTSWRTYFKVDEAVSVAAQRLTLFAGLGVLAVSLLLWFVQHVVRWHRESPLTSRQRWFLGLGGVSGGAYLLFLVAIAAVAVLDIDMESGIPWFLLVALVLVNVGALAALATPIMLLRIWSSAAVSGTTRLHYATYALAALVVTVIYWHWNVLGMKT